MPRDTPAVAEWARGFSRQALSDLRAYEILKQAGAEKCHRLHYLQMATEKACKAHASGTSHTPVLRHDRIAKDLPTLARHFYGLSGIAREDLNRRCSLIKGYAREIQLLSPACNSEDNTWPENTRPDNCEYPWQTADGEVRSPCEHDFPSIDDNKREIIDILKLIRKAARAIATG